ncbi:MAG: hypothetical protein ACREH4_12480 [Vitreimonas sp.]
MRAGAGIGAAGSSGKSSEPRLHFQVIDGPDLDTARGLPVIFEGLRDDWIAMGGRQLRAGDVIEREQCDGGRALPPGAATAASDPEADILNLR